MNFIPVTLLHYLIILFLIFIIALIGTVISKNLIKILICIEIMMCSVSATFVAFATYHDAILLQGFIFMLFITAISTVQTAIALFLIYLIYNNKKSLTSDEIEELKG